MARLTAFAEAEQLSLDDVLAEFRDGAPPEGLSAARQAVAATEKGDPRLPAVTDPDVIRADLGTQGDVSQAKIGSEPHDGLSALTQAGLCPFRAECYEALGLVTQHCAWNLDDPPTWRFCGGYKRRNGGIR